jgi:hypothetical protein
MAYWPFFLFLVPLPVQARPVAPPAGVTVTVMEPVLETAMVLAVGSEVETATATVASSSEMAMEKSRPGMSVAQCFL